MKGYKFAKKSVRDVQNKFFATAKPVARNWEVKVKKAPFSRELMFYIEQK